MLTLTKDGYKLAKMLRDLNAMFGISTNASGKLQSIIILDNEFNKSFQKNKDKKARVKLTTSIDNITTSQESSILTPLTANNGSILNLYDNRTFKIESAGSNVEFRTIGTYHDNPFEAVDHRGHNKLAIQSLILRKFMTHEDYNDYKNQECRLLADNVEKRYKEIFLFLQKNPVVTVGAGKGATYTIADAKIRGRSIEEVFHIPDTLSM